MSDLVTLTRDGEVAVITINNPPVNALSPGVPEGIAAAIEGDRQGRWPQGCGFSSAPERHSSPVLTSASSGRSLLDKSGEGINFVDLLLGIEDCPKPVIAAIHGTAFGGGLETAMACHYRVAVASAQVGQPEVNLGLIPGAAGTQRLPRLTGVAVGVEMCAFGAPVRAQTAFETGIVDRVIEGDLLEGATGICARADRKGRSTA
jgi:3-hydroxyacyl-CoA dehydrogenase